MNEIQADAKETNAEQQRKKSQKKTEQEYVRKSAPMKEGREADPCH
jgi:hypothetical protein